MRLRLAASLLVLAVAAQSTVVAPAFARQDDGPVVTARDAGESADALRAREAIAYETPLPRGAPTQDYPLVAWCAALVEGHIALGQSLTSADDLDRDIMRLGGLEAADFRDALQAGQGRQTPAILAAARTAEADAASKWQPLMSQEDERARSEAFGLFFGLPGRCEHAARRVRENITTPPVTLDQAGLDEVGVPKAN